MNYYHVHSTLSNATTIIDSITNYQTYIDKAKEYGCKVFGFSEHGNLLNWYHKKQAIEKAGMKYIHGVEMYVTETLNKKIRDNYHVILMARNLEGFKELNRLVSKGFNRAETKVIDNKERFYYNPRISYDELKKISDNIILTTACIANILGSNNKNLKEDFIRFMAKNKHKCFLEIQHHQTIQQANYNKYLIQLHEKYAIPLIAGTDTHMLTENEFRGRELLQKRKNIHFDNEEGWSLALYDRNTLIEMYKKQNAIDEKYYIQAIDNTNLLDDLIENYDIDTSNKYPKISDTPYKDVLNLCKQGIEEKGLKFAGELKDRIYYELDVYEQNKALELMLLEYDVKKWARDNNIFYGESRGSVSGSMVAYLMDITKVNSMKYNMNFERFMNKERVGGLADIDSDWMPSRRDDVKEYLHNNPKFYTSEIITFNTIAEKGSIRDIGGALDIPLETINDICKNLENTKIIDDYKKQYPDLFKYAKQVEGTITSIGSHPAATICSPVDIVENISTITLDTNKYPVSSLNMEEVESLNYLKLDLLGLRNIEIIYNTCKLAGIKPLKSDDMDFDDEEVWKDIMKSPVGIFQFEDDFSHSILKRTFSKETLSKIRKNNPNIDYLYLMSVANGAIRPAGASYRDALANGEIHDNGHFALNEFLKDSNGFLVFQEQIIQFLHEFCGFTMGEADVVRRGFAKKTGTEQYIPQIKKEFVKTMELKYGIDREVSEKLILDFIQVIHDASDYIFSLNHALPYSMIGYMCGWLRYYYPAEFVTTLFELNKDNQAKTSIIYDYMVKFTDMQINPAKFRYSSSNYTIDKHTNSIYKGIASIKNISYGLGEELYALKDNKYNNFMELLYDIKDKTSCNSRELDILIKLGFFEEFGKSQKLSVFVNYFDKLYKAKVVNKTKLDDYANEIISKYSRQTEKQFRDLDNKKILLEIWDAIPNNELSILKRVKAQQDYLGYIDYANPKLNKRYILVTNLNTKYSPRFTAYCLNNGKTQELKVYKQGRNKKITYFNEYPFKDGDLLYAKEFNSKPKSMKTEDGWKNIPNTKEWWLTSYSVVSYEEIQNKI